MKTGILPVRFVGVSLLSFALVGCNAAVRTDPDGPPDEMMEGGQGGTAGRTGTGGSRTAGTGGAPATGGTGGGPTGTTGGAGGGGRSDGGAPNPGDGGGGPVGPVGPVGPPPGTMSDYTAPKVVVSEIMYHAVMENAAEEHHEFLEIANRTESPVEIGGWKITGDVEFTFPAKVTLAAKQHLVIAKNPAKLAAAWMLNAASLQGPYMGQLDNGGGRVTILDAAGAKVDEVTFSDRAPWPLSADALGAGEAWLRADSLPLAKHQYKGRSLERISFDVSPQEPVNWNASPVSGATPGKANSQAGKIDAIVERISPEVKGEAGRTLFRKDDSIVIRAVLSARGIAKTPQLEYFVDDVEKTGEATTKLPMTKGENGWEATVPPQPDNSIVRYRVLADRGDGPAVQIGPRTSDPYEWYAYFVTPNVTGKTPLYHLFINRAKWSELYRNVQGGRVPGAPAQCKPNATWNNKVPAVLVAGGRVYDVTARYQGSPYNRTNGPTIPVAKFPADKAPTTPNPLKALSWHFDFPRYAPLDGKRRDLLLNKRAYECGFITTSVGGRLFESIGLPAPRVTLGRLYVNGVYYHYMTDVEHPDEDMLARFYGKDHQVGDWFKVVGYNQEQGPYTWSDGRPIVAGCGYTAAQRYTFNYDRVTPDWKTESTEAQKLIEDLTAARMGGVPGMKKFFTDNFDLKLTTDYYAMLNWLGPWDDFFQNHFLYKRADGKWIVTPWDFDALFGLSGIVTSSGSFYVGELMDRSNRIVGDPYNSTIQVKWNSYMKDAFIKAFRSELQARWKEMATKELAPAAVNKLLDEVLALYAIDEAKSAASGVFCDPAGMVNSIKKFTTERNARVAAGMFQ